MALAACLAVGPAAHAVPILDQENISADGTPGFAALGVEASQAVAQTFTAGMAGILAKVALQVYRPDDADSSSPLRLHILPLESDGAPTEDYTRALAAVDISASSVPMRSDSLRGSLFTSIDLESFNIPIAVGDVLAIALTAASGNYAWTLSPVGFPDYLGGNDWTRFLANDWREQPSDVGFRTFVDADAPAPDPVPVPAPDSLLLLLCALIGLCAVRRRPFAHR